MHIRYTVSASNGPESYVTKEYEKIALEIDDAYSPELYMFCGEVECECDLVCEDCHDITNIERGCKCASTSGCCGPKGEDECSGSCNQGCGCYVYECEEDHTFQGASPSDVTGGKHPVGYLPIYSLLEMEAVFAGATRVLAKLG